MSFTLKKKLFECVLLSGRILICSFKCHSCFLLPANVPFKKESYFKTCHSIQAHLVSGESGTSNYLIFKCLVNKLLVNFWQLLETCSRQVKEVMRSAFGGRQVTQRDLIQGQPAFWVVAGKGLGGWGTGKQAGSNSRGQEDETGCGRTGDCVLTFPVRLTKSQP